MTVTALTSAAATATASTASAKGAVDYESFLKLLVAQAKNQDPTNPMDSTAYMSQLAAFSSVEQAIQTNAKLDSILKTGGLAQGASLVGLHVAAADGSASGIVRSVAMQDGQTVATLDDGATLVIGDAVTVSKT